MRRISTGRHRFGRGHLGRALCSIMEFMNLNVDKQINGADRIKPTSGSILKWAAALVLICQSGMAEEPEREISFNRDIRPLLSDRCFLCHGPDQSSPEASETELRLDQRESAVELGVFDWEDVDASEILSRVRSEDPDLRMPPSEMGKRPLDSSEVQLLRDWISKGAPYESHWAYVAPRRPPVPPVSDPQWQGHPIDAFVMKEFRARGLAPSPTADRATLIRRLSLDLTGLPPRLEDVHRFVNDPASDDRAWEKMVDQTLASRHYAEHMARHWLDAARYADTSGYQYDRERTQWVWRDWVIHAFHANQPFDEFTIDQVAGDLLPHATDQTRLATGFHRNHPITIEGGVVDEEYRTEYVIDRVVTASTVWLGQTFLCARCHDHKYDPVSQEDFYRFYAYFNNVPEKGLNGFDPRQKIVSPLAVGEIKRLEKRVADRRRQFAELELPWAQWREEWRQHADQWSILKPRSVTSSGGAIPRNLEDGSVLMTGPNPEQDDYEIILHSSTAVQSLRLEALAHPELTNGSASRGSNGNFVLTEWTVSVRDSDVADGWLPVAVSRATADYEQAGFSIDQAIDGKLNRQGWAVDGHQKPENRVAIFELAEKIPSGQQFRIQMRHRYGVSHQIGRFRISSAAEQPYSPPVVEWLKGDAPGPPPSEIARELVARWGSRSAREVLEQWVAAEEELARLNDFPATMILAERPDPRPTYLLERGAYDQPDRERILTPGVPAAIGSIEIDDFPADRLGLAQWLVHPQQPLTARVTVNRFWQQLFGNGLVKTSEDFGFQGAYPSHPELLDWLAVEFVESGWDVKRLLKTIVLSRTYRQSSCSTADQWEQDPENVWLARGSRYRLDAEQIRDGALAVAGLLDRTVGGPSVYPYHPEGLWLEINNRPNFSRAYPHTVQSDQLYRRSLYTFWKRTVPPPSLATLDAPEREYCVVRRSRTNTPFAGPCPVARSAICRSRPGAGHQNADRRGEFSAGPGCLWIPTVRRTASRCRRAGAVNDGIPAGPGAISKEPRCGGHPAVGRGVASGKRCRSRRVGRDDSGRPPASESE